MPLDGDLREQILRAVQARQGSGMRRSELRREVGGVRGGDAQRFREIFRDLCAEGVLLRQRGGRYVLAVTRELIAGTVQVSYRGFGFVTRQDGGADIFIPPQFLNGAISGDRVLVVLREPEDERGPVGEIERITERVHRVLVASLVELPTGPAVRPLRRELPAFVMLADSGDVVSPDEIDRATGWRSRYCPQGSPREPLQAVVLRRLAAADPITADPDAAVRSSTCPRPTARSGAAGGREDRAGGRAPGGRHRAGRGELSIRWTRSDFDDGVSIAPGRARRGDLGAHIADVAVFVAPGTPVDRRRAPACFHLLPAGADAADAAAGSGPRGSAA